mgnify:FL=1
MIFVDISIVKLYYRAAGTAVTWRSDMQIRIEVLSMSC